jgi:lipopolysaccharide/colanic/teichoic acid biosynthesis glycosyltransferase
MNNQLTLTGSLSEFGQGNPGLVYNLVKRAADLMFSGLGLLILSPFFVLLGVLIRLDSRGSVLFSQQRVGKNGRVFSCWKFRSMTTDAEVLKHSLQSANEVTDGPTFKMRHDPRITRVGRWIRRASIDELPQLWNVFVGDMTLVGPRPPVPEEVEQYSEYEWRRLSVVPGITCFWQVSGRSELPFQEQVRLDIEYIEQRDLITDIRILLLTVPAVLSGRGAY